MLNATKDKFFASFETDPNSGCWLWTKYLTHRGYAQIRVGPKVMKGHRVSLMIGGIDPTGLCVLHKCDTRSCVNPNHLFVGTNADNMADRDNKGRQASGSRNGSAKLTEGAVATIRRRRQDGEKTFILATDYGVSQSLVRQITRGIGWKHVA